ncbi:integrase arm-type DNA-binding domain-containing protein [Sphingobium sp. AN641]|uniref:tyrosine-type recombinase/integrase n=1 Tax=Sphingobium sp. AN641 TaxID=3133443 RepID=UPI0030BE57D7
MALADITIRNAKPREKSYKLADSLGLFLLVTPSGGKLWKLKFRVDGLEKKLSLGSYPDVSLTEARKKRDDARKALAAGTDPALEKRLAKLRRREDVANTFSVIAREFFEKRASDGDKAWSAATLQKNEWLHGLLAPTIGKRPVSDIRPFEVLEAVQSFARKGNRETARRALQMASAVFRYAVATARLESDPVRDLKGALPAPSTRSHAAILDPVKLGELLRAIDGYSGNTSTLYALQLIPHVFTRPGELRQATWQEIDFDAAVWTIPAGRMKMRRAHHVPLSKQALTILKAAKAITNRETGYIFPSIRSIARPISNNTMNAAMRRMGFASDEVTAHGFRATASSLLNEARDRQGKPMWSSDAIERALAHGDDDKIRGIYNRSPYWAERVEMAQWWSERLDQIRAGAEIVPIGRPNVRRRRN